MRKPQRSCNALHACFGPDQDFFDYGQPCKAPGTVPKAGEKTETLRPEAPRALVPSASFREASSEALRSGSCSKTARAACPSRDYPTDSPPIGTHLPDA